MPDKFSLMKIKITLKSPKNQLELYFLERKMKSTGTASLNIGFA